MWNRFLDPPLLGSMLLCASGTYWVWVAVFGLLEGSKQVLRGFQAMGNLGWLKSYMSAMNATSTSLVVSSRKLRVLELHTAEFLQRIPRGVSDLPNKKFWVVHGWGY